MSLSPSLRNRIRRLEQSVQAQATLSVADAMHRQRAHRLSLTPLERTINLVDDIQESMRLLDEPPPRSADFSYEMRMSRARRYVSDLAELYAPDLPAADPRSLEPFWAWSRQQSRRANAKKYLAMVAEVDAASPAFVAAARRAEAEWLATWDK